MKKLSDAVKFPKDAGWLIPGLQVKRWLIMIFVGAVFMALGLLILCDIRPIFYTMEFIKNLLLEFLPSGLRLRS